MIQYSRNNSEVKEHTQEIRTTSVEVYDTEGDKRVISFKTEAVMFKLNGDSPSISTEMVFNSPVGKLYDEEILDTLEAQLDTIFAQKDRVPEFVAKVETLLRKYTERSDLE